MSSPRRRVGVWRCGVASSFGLGHEALWAGLLDGRLGIGPTPASSRGIPTPASCGAASAALAAIEARLDARVLRRLSGVARLSLGAASACLETLPEALREATAVVLGTCFGASAYHFEYYEKLFRGGLREASPLLFSESVMNAAAGHISIHGKLRGASLALLGGEDVGLGALLDARDRILLGEAAAAIAGGVEELCDFVHAAVAARGIVSGEPGAPHGQDGRGTFLAEGAALLLLAASDRSPPAEPLCWIDGAGAARGGSQRGPAGAVERAVLEALREASVAPADVALVVTSAGGDALDRPLAEGLARALRSGAAAGRELLLVAPRAALGEGFAFTSAAQAVVAALALETGTVPPTPGRGGPVDLPPGLSLPSAVQPLVGRHALAVTLNRCGAATCLLLSAQAVMPPSTESTWPVM